MDETVPNQRERESGVVQVVEWCAGAVEGVGGECVCVRGREGRREKGRRGGSGNHISPRAQEYILGEASRVDTQVVLLEGVHVQLPTHGS